MAGMPDWLSYDPHTDALTIDGIRYARELFKVLASDEVGTAFRIESRENGVLGLRRLEDI